MTFTHSSRWVEWLNTRKSIGNGFPMKKYVGAVVRKSFQLVIAAEIEHFEHKSPVPKIIHLFPASELFKKNKTIFSLLVQNSKNSNLRKMWICGRWGSGICGKTYAFSKPKGYFLAKEIIDWGFVQNYSSPEKEIARSEILPTSTMLKDGNAEVEDVAQIGRICGTGSICGNCAHNRRFDKFQTNAFQFIMFRLRIDSMRSKYDFGRCAHK